MTVIQALDAYRSKLMGGHPAAYEATSPHIDAVRELAQSQPAVFTLAGLWQAGYIPTFNQLWVAVEEWQVMLEAMLR